VSARRSAVVPPKTSDVKNIEKCVVPQTNANTRAESEPGAALAGLPPLMLLFVLYKSPAVLKG